MTTTIHAIELREIELPLKEPFRISSGQVHTRRILLAEVTDGNGARSWAECVAGGAPNYSPETIDTCWQAITLWAAPRVLGRPIDHPTEVQGVLDENFRGHNMAKATIEMAAWGLAASHRGVSLAKLIGGSRDRIATGISLGIQESPERLVEKAAAALDAGYRKVKIKIQPGADLEYVRAVRESLGPDAPLMVDANNAYGQDDFDHLQRFDDLGLIMIEQPLAWDDVVRHAALQARMKTPICLDESIANVERVRDMIELQSGRIVNVKPGRVGGFAASKAIHDLCRDNDIPVWCGGMLESGIGRAYNVALASLDNFTLPGDLSPSARYWERDIVTPEWTMDADGWVAVPDAPGIGVAVDRDRVDDLTVRAATLSA